MLEKAAIEIFYVYASEDEELCKELEKHIRPLIREGLVRAWNCRNITAGTEWATETDRRLNTAQLILLLISPDFLASDYCYSVEMERALERHDEGSARVIPIILRPANWKNMPFGKLQTLPKNGNPIKVKNQESLDDAFVHVARGIEEVVNEIQSKSDRPASTPEAQSHLEKALSIHGATYPLTKIFCNDYIFTIPLFQRAYAWTTEQVEALLDDLLAFVSESSSEMVNEYFLGSIVVIKKSESPYSAIIDGQQRLITLTILFAVLRELLPEHADELTDFLYQKGRPMVGEPNTYRLIPRERDAEFFKLYIQEKGGIAQLRELDLAILLRRLNVSTLPESQVRMRENALFFLQRLGQLSREELAYLASTIVTRCFLVVVSTPSFESAYRIFSVLNDRGLNLAPGDILKAEILGKISDSNKHKEYTRKWEEIEEQLGSEQFQALFADICLIYRKTRLRESVLTEFRKHVRHTLDSSEQFIDEVLPRYSDAFYIVKNAKYEGYNQAHIISTTSNQQNQTRWLIDNINSELRWLNLIEQANWMPAAMFYLVQRRPHENDLALLRFLSDLERLTAGLMILRENAHRRINRFCQVLKAIDGEQELYAANSPLQLTSAECHAILEALNGDVSALTGAPLRYVLLRLNALFAEAQAPLKGMLVTVEQVLPPSSGNGSWSSFNQNKNHTKYANKLGNMVLLFRKKDSKLSKLDFQEKKRRYLRSERGSLPLSLTEQVLNETEWTPKVIEQRQQMLLERLQDHWRL